VAGVETAKLFPLSAATCPPLANTTKTYEALTELFATGVWLSLETPPPPEPEQPNRHGDVTVALKDSRSRARRYRNAAVARNGLPKRGRLGHMFRREERGNRSQAGGNAILQRRKSAQHCGQSDGRLQPCSKSWKWPSGL
jgi:hypothetical protein